MRTSTPKLCRDDSRQPCAFLRTINPWIHYPRINFDMSELTCIFDFNSSGTRRTGCCVIRLTAAVRPLVYPPDHLDPFHNSGDQRFFIFSSFLSPVGRKLRKYFTTRGEKIGRKIFCCICRRTRPFSVVASSTSSRLPPERIWKFFHWFRGKTVRGVRASM